MLLLPCFINIWREIYPFNFTFLLIDKKAFLRSQLPFLIIFFSKTTGDIDMSIGIDSRTYTRSFQQNSEKNLSKTYIIFLRKCNLLKTGTCTFVAITQKLKLFGQNLLSNYYSPSKFLSIGIQYVKLFGVKIFHTFFSKFFAIFFL